MMEGPRHQHLHQEWQEPLEELAVLGGQSQHEERRGVLG